MNARGQDPTETPRDPNNLSFSQANGYEDIPGPLKLEELPEEARTHIWNVFYKSLDQSVNRDIMGYPYLINPWRDMMNAVYGDYFGLPLHEWGALLEKVASRFNKIHFNERTRGGEGQYIGEIASKLIEHIKMQPFNQIFDLVHFVMRQPECPSDFISNMKRAFTQSRLAYTINIEPKPTIFPTATKNEGEALIESLETLRRAGLSGGEAHLRKASDCINQGDWAESIKESIHAVESVARIIDPNASQTLRPTLLSIEKHGELHPALKDAFIKLYGYASDEQGIRHALLNGDGANVGMDEALFMLGACASFASYLWRKHQTNSGA